MKEKFDADKAFLQVMAMMKDNDEALKNKGIRLVISEDNKQEFDQAVSLDSLAWSLIDGYEECEGATIELMEEIKCFLSVLNPEIQFLVADNLVDYFTRGWVRFTGLPYVDNQLLPIYCTLCDTVTPLCVTKKNK